MYNIMKRFFRIAVSFIRSQDAFYRKLLRLFRPIRKDYRIWERMTLYRYLLFYQKNIEFDKCYWMGVRAAKNPFDAWIYQEIIYETKPDIIIEIGSAEGGSTLYFANLLDLIGKGQVISIDTTRAKYKVQHHRIITLTGDSSSAEIIAKVYELCRGKSVLVVHDGDHREEQVLGDLHAYSRLVSVNSYFIVEDGIIDLFKPGDGIGAFDEGPLIAIEKFLRSNSNFCIDREKEHFILTYNPKGFLKRIR